MDFLSKARFLMQIFSQNKHQRCNLRLWHWILPSSIPLTKRKLGTHMNRLLNSSSFFQKLTLKKSHKLPHVFWISRQPSSKRTKLTYLNRVCGVLSVIYPRLSSGMSEANLWKFNENTWKYTSNDTNSVRFELRTTVSQNISQIQK